MQNINFITFIDLIKTSKVIKQMNIRLMPSDILYIDEFNDLEVIDCSFEGSDLIIKSKQDIEISRLIFKNTSFEGISLYDVKMQNFQISNLKIDYIDINNSTFKNLSITEFKDVNYSIKLNKVICENRTEILGNDFINNGQLLIFNSSLNNCRFIESTFNDVLMLSSILKGRFDFYGNNLNKGNNRFLFDDCIFEKSNFSRTTLNKNTQFNNCDFKKTSLFHDVYGYQTLLSFESCLFEKYVQFNHASLTKLEIDNSKFNESSSFQDTKFDTISIERTVFEKTALFDNINILEIKKCDIRTLRTIKQQLQKAENKIDYNRFRAYELSAYYRELQWNWKDSKDKFILGTTWLSTGFDHSWRRALLFTIVSGLFWYSIVYFFEFFFALNLAGDDNFMKGAFRFFLVTDFSSPFRAKGEFLENWGIWIPLVIGKIFIAFGIYEMIQAFRKFKA